MAECKHELKDLVGMADGIHCKACGAIFKTIEEAQEKKPEKKEGKKNARK